MTEPTPKRQRVEQANRPNADWKAAEEPAEFLCPISLAVMDEPVLATDGHTYELCMIQQWQASHGTSPITGEKLGKIPLVLDLDHLSCRKSAHAKSSSQVAHFCLAKEFACHRDHAAVSSAIFKR